MIKMLSELLWPVYFATLWWGTDLTKSRWLIKCHLVSRAWERSFISRWQGVQGPTVSSMMLCDSDPRPPQGRTLWQGEGATFHPVHVSRVICCTCWRHCERWVDHHSSSLSLAFALRHLIYYMVCIPDRFNARKSLAIAFWLSLDFSHVLLRIRFHKKCSIAANLLLPVGAWEEVRIFTEKSKNINIGK